jgi:hypothetical protein
LDHDARCNPVVSARHQSNGSRDRLRSICGLSATSAGLQLSLNLGCSPPADTRHIPSLPFDASHAGYLSVENCVIARPAGAHGFSPHHKTTGCRR